MRDEKVPIQFKKELLKQHFGSGTRPKIFDKSQIVLKKLL